MEAVTETASDRIIGDALVVEDEHTRRIVREIDFDALFRNSHDKVVLNKFDFLTPGYAQKLSDAIFSRSADIDFIARCECGHLQGNFYIDQDCPKCRTKVTTDMEAATGHLHHRVWIECPEQIKGWLNPSAFFVLSRWLSYSRKTSGNYTNARGDVANKNKKKKGNYLEDILDVTTEIPDELKGVIDGKGFNYFFDNFDYIMEFFLRSFKKTATKKNSPSIEMYIKKYRNQLFCRYFPVLAASLHAVVMSEGVRDNRKKYVDRICQYVQHAAQTLSYIEFAPRKYKSHSEIESATFTAFQDIIAYTSTIARKHLSEKRALPRMHMFGSRLHLSFRSVVVPIVGQHRIEELHLPWVIGNNTFRVDIIGILMREHGMSLSEAYNRQQIALVRFDPVIYQIITRLIAECPYPGIPVIFTRNPSIRSGSSQLLFVTKVKPDVEDENIGFSALATPPPNADFDGDAMNGFRIVEMDAVKDFMAMHPANLYLSRNELKVTNFYTIPKLPLLAINTFLRRV